jgi:hypothetical protein
MFILLPEFKKPENERAMKRGYLLPQIEPTALFFDTKF